MSLKDRSFVSAWGFISHTLVTLATAVSSSRIGFCCLFPASWHFSLPTINSSSCQRLTLLLLFLFLLSCLLLFAAVKGPLHWGPSVHDGHYEKYLQRVIDLEATDTDDPELNYGIVIDCGSSGSRVFVYYWPRHNGNPHDLLDIHQMRDGDRQPVVKKIKPGISTLAFTPEKASDYVRPLLSYATRFIPVKKHKETPLYILCTAGMRLLPESQQTAILEDLNMDIPLEFGFLFSDSHTEVISGKQEGVYAWIGINFVLGRFDHGETDDDAVVAVTVGGQNQMPLIRKRTVGIIDMGGASLQIAYEVPNSVTFTSPEQEEAAKTLLAEFNLGCDVQHTEHVYRVYVTTFLGFGGNFARQRYEDLVLNDTLTKAKLLGQLVGLSPDAPHLDPCSPIGLTDTLQRDGRTVHLRGTGDWDRCREMVRPFLSKTNTTGTSLMGVYQSPINFTNSEFYGFSEFYYCMEDVLRIGGHYDSRRYARAAKDYCATKWSALTQRFESRLFSSHADQHRLKYQCFKSAWMYEVLHSGFDFPLDYPNLHTAQLVYDKEVQWTLGAILYKTRFLPLRDLRQESLKSSHAMWPRFSFVYNHYLFFVCLAIVLLAIVLYVLRLRRIHRRHTASLDLLWIEGEPLKADEVRS
ncbi:ectonucleoside triphosphate diphosphohydrolase 7 [Latimeria chalumnae]|uniref:ectonucleoside triphosphate diphosphohydrolase 7 n=1 Tax=Latimeria chalumnae TaxID=7897 RepID=UPI00313D9648